MRRILFCNIAWMEKYNGIAYDPPQGGGSWVEENQDAYEKYNFNPVEVTRDFNPDFVKDGEAYCLGFVETKEINGYKNQMHIEKIMGCEDDKYEDYVDDILVVYCAKHPEYDYTCVVGWYSHATVFRMHQEVEILNALKDEESYQIFNALAHADNCVLLPVSQREEERWRVSRKNKGAAYGFGQANVWYARENADNSVEQNVLLNEFLDRLVQQIETYNNENYLCKDAE